MAYERAASRAHDPSSVKVILANDDDVTTRKVVILSGQKLLAGALIGKIEEGAATITAGTVVSASGGTPGNGSIGTVTADADAQEGVYQQLFIAAASNGGTFLLLRPDGAVDGTGVVGTAYDGMLNFTQADGSNDFVVGDRRPITVDYAEGSAKYKLSLAAATDGSEVPDLVLSQDTDASAGDVEAIAYETATVLKDALVLGSGHTIASIRPGLRLKGIKIDD